MEIKISKTKMKKRNIFQKDIFKEQFFVCFGAETPEVETERVDTKIDSVNPSEAVEVNITETPKEQTLLEDITAEIKNANSDSKTEEKVISKKIDKIDFNNGQITTEIILLLGKNNHKKLIRQIEKKIISNSAPLINDQNAVLLMVESPNKLLESNKSFQYYSTKPMVDLIIKSTRLLKPEEDESEDIVFFYTKILKKKKQFTKNAENAGNLIYALDGYVIKSQSIGLIIKAYEDKLPLLISGWKKSNTDKSNLEFIYKKSKIAENIKNPENINFICILLNNLDNDKQKEIVQILMA